MSAAPIELLIVVASSTGRTRRLAEAAAEGAREAFTAALSCAGDAFLFSYSNLEFKLAAQTLIQ